MAMYSKGALMLVPLVRKEPLQARLDTVYAIFHREEIQHLILCECSEIPRLDDLPNLKRLDIEFDRSVALPLRSLPSPIQHLEIEYHHTTPPREGTILHHTAFPSLLEIAGRNVIQYSLL